MKNKRIGQGLLIATIVGLSLNAKSGRFDYGYEASIDQGGFAGAQSAAASLGMERSVGVRDQSYTKKDFKKDKKELKQQVKLGRISKQDFKQEVKELKQRLNSSNQPQKSSKSKQQKRVVRSRYVAEKDAPTMIRDVVERVGAARGGIVNDAQVNLTPESAPDAFIQARMLFFDDVKDIFTRDGLQVGDAGYRLHRYQLKLLLTLLTGKATANDLAEIATIILNNPGAPEFTPDMVGFYAVHDFLIPEDKRAVEGWLIAGYAGDPTYFSSEHCAPPAGVVVNEASFDMGYAEQAPVVGDENMSRHGRYVAEPFVLPAQQLPVEQEFTSSYDDSFDFGDASTMKELKHDRKEEIQALKQKKAAGEITPQEFKEMKKALQKEFKAQKRDIR